MMSLFEARPHREVEQTFMAYSPSLIPQKQG